MSGGVEAILPSEIFEAIGYAKQKDPTDKHGDGAFKLDYGNIRLGKQGGIRYADFDVLKKNKAGEWKYIPLNLKFMNLLTKAKIYPPNHEKKKIPGARLQFSGSSTYFDKGKEERYGAAKIAIYAAFARIIKKLLNQKTINNGSNNKICSTIQTEAIIDEKTKATKKLDDPIIRVDIPFDSQQSGNQKIIKADASPKCEIYDACKKLKDIPKGQWPFERATFEKTPLNYTNIGEFITAGSSCSGVDCMNSVSLSNMGISLASKITLAVIKHSDGFKPQPTSIFSIDEFDEMAGATTETIEDPDVAKPSAPPVSIPAGEAGDFTSDINPDNYDPDDANTFGDD